MSFKQMRGDLFTELDSGDYDIVIHGCNCRNQMGAGIAKPMAQKFPIAKQADDKACAKGENKPGNISVGLTQRRGRNLFIVNAYTQQSYGSDPNTKYASLKALKSALAVVRTKLGKKMQDEPNGPWRPRRVLMPKIGCGYGNLNWSEVKPIILEELATLNVTICDRK
jgi:O-acetyl-ADP-ribose deacetylase (regulator of RNase III)